MLRHFFGKARRGRAWGKPRVLVPISGDTTPVERRAVLSSAHRAGAGQVLLIAKLKAAALGAGLPVAEPVASMVCEIGAGATEVGVISLADLVAHRSIRIAGREMDQAVADYVRRHFSLRISPRSAERLRREIGSARDLPSELASEVRGVDQVSGLPREASSPVNRSAKPRKPLDRIVDAISSTLDRLDPELAADLMGQGLVLCGGGAPAFGHRPDDCRADRIARAAGSRAGVDRGSRRAGLSRTSRPVGIAARRGSPRLACTGRNPESLISRPAWSSWAPVWRLPARWRCFRLIGQAPSVGRC